MKKLIEIYYKRDVKNLLCMDDWPDLMELIKKTKKIIFKEIKKIWHSEMDLNMRK